MDEIKDLVERIRSEADIATRPGQYYRLHQIALQLEALSLNLKGQ